MPHPLCIALYLTALLVLAITLSNPAQTPTQPSKE
jgi:hypothetical protein